MESVSKPITGKEFDDMYFDKLRYKSAIKSKETHSKNQFSESLNDVLLSKDVPAFWNIWRSKFSKSKPPPVLDGYCDDQSIADCFAGVLGATCVPNSESRHAE